MVCFWTYSYSQMFKFWIIHYFHVKMCHSLTFNTLKSLLRFTSPKHWSTVIIIKIKATARYIKISMADNNSYYYLHGISVYRMLSDTIFVNVVYYHYIHFADEKTKAQKKLPRAHIKKMANPDLCLSRFSRLLDWRHEVWADKSLDVGFSSFKRQ